MKIRLFLSIVLVLGCHTMAASDAAAAADVNWNDRIERFCTPGFVPTAMDVLAGDAYLKLEERFARLEESAASRLLKRQKEILESYFGSEGSLRGAIGTYVSDVSKLIGDKDAKSSYCNFMKSELRSFLDELYLEALEWLLNKENAPGALTVCYVFKAERYYHELAMRCGDHANFLYKKCKEYDDSLKK